jgi:hypothetical protein
MNDQEFLGRLTRWETKLAKRDDRDYSKYDALCALYLEATSKQRSLLLDFLARRDMLPWHEWIGKLKLTPYEELLGDLTVYMGWDSKRIKSSSDVYPLRLGLAAAAIIGEGLDHFDVAVSLAFLYFAAKGAGIEPVPHFKEIAETARPEAKEVILSFLKRDETKIRSDLNLDYFYKVDDELNLPYKELDLD